VDFQNIYGVPPDELISLADTPRQFSPLFPGADDMSEIPAQSLDNLVILAPPGTIERRYAIALGLKAVAPGAPFIVLAPKDKGGSRLAKDLKDFGCAFVEDARRHHRICTITSCGDAAALDAALAEGAPRLDEGLKLWTQPGVFSWNRLDPGSALLLQHLPKLSGNGADFGCGLGVLAHKVLANDKVTRLALIDIDRRAIDMAKRNLADPRIDFLWADARTVKHAKPLDFVVMNPPFHEGGIENQSLGQNFIHSAAKALRPGGVCWLTANRHLPYEAVMKPLFKNVTAVAEAGGFKIYEARK